MTVGLAGASRRAGSWPGELGPRPARAWGGRASGRDCGALRVKPPGGAGRGPGAILAVGGSFLGRAGEGRLLPPPGRPARSRFEDGEEKHGNWPSPKQTRAGGSGPGPAGRPPDALSRQRLGLPLPLVTPGARRRRSSRQFSNCSAPGAARLGAQLRSWWGRTLRD